MPKILVVDDSETNREYLITLLTHFGHTILESEDGAHGLNAARAERPDLIIADILMPTMDGYEFVRRLRLDDSIATIPVVFCTAHFHEREAKNLAQACGVSHILTKPAEPEEVLRVVDLLLGVSPPQSDLVMSPFDFDREHVRLLTDKLSENTNWLRSTNERLSAMIELGIKLGSERDPLRLLISYCKTVREILGARLVLVGIISDGGVGFRYLLENGIERSLGNSRLSPAEGILQGILKDCQNFRSSAGQALPPLPHYFPAGTSYLICPVVSLSRVYGWVCAIDKQGDGEFSEDDERISTILASQVGRIYENGRLYVDLLQKVDELHSEIQERRRAEAELERFFTQSQNLLCVLDFDGRIKRANPAWETVLGYHPLDLLDRPLAGFLSETQQEDFLHRLHSLRSGAPKSTIETRCVTSDGSFKWILWTIMPFTDHGGVYATGHDLTERRAAEDALRENEQRLRQIAESIREVIWLTDLASDEILYVSPAYELIWGNTCASLYASPRSWLDCIHPQDRQTALDGLKTAAEGNVSEVSYRLTLPNGSSRSVRDHRFPIYNEAGKVYRVAGVAEDVTEKLSLEEQLRQSQKMEAIGVLAGGVAHDFNNLLTVINGYAEFLVERLPEGHASREQAKHILKAGGQAATLTQQLLAFSRKQVLVPEVLDLNAVILDTKKMLGRIIGEDIHLHIEPAGDLWSTKVDRGQMEQVIMNLVVNARDAMPRGGELRIETANVVFDHAEANQLPRIDEGEYVRLSVVDNGSGMDDATKTRIFEPFFTTKEVHKGTGLGLSTVFGIVNQSRGHIDVETELGKGTAFHIYLRRDQSKAAAVVSRKGTDAPPGNETVLLVEDDQTVREFAQQVLTHYGYSVLVAHNGLDALQKVRTHDGDIHLLMTDVVMPHLGGQKLSDQIEELRPGIKVLFMSGYTDDKIVQHLDRSANVAFIQKPFSPGGLARKIRQVLDHKA